MNSDRQYATNIYWLNEILVASCSTSSSFCMSSSVWESHVFGPSLLLEDQIFNGIRGIVT